MKNLKNEQVQVNFVRECGGETDRTPYELMMNGCPYCPECGVEIETIIDVLIYQNMEGVIK